MKRILVPIDFSPFSLQALRYGCVLARQNNAELFLLHVVQDLTPISVGGGGIIASSAAEYIDQLESSAEEALAEVPSRSIGKDLKLRRQTVIGSPRYAIVDFAETHEIDLICLGTHGRGGLSRMLLGSVAEKVVQHAPCPTLVVRRHEREFVQDNRDEPRIRRILAPVDFSDASRVAADEATKLAAQFDAELHLLHVVEDSSPGVSEIALAYPVFQSFVHELVKSSQKQLDELTANNSGPTGTVRKVVIGAAIHKINDYADEHQMDLIVMGTHGRTGPVHWLLGSVAERVVRSAPCPVLVIPQQRTASGKAPQAAKPLAASLQHETAH